MRQNDQMHMFFSPLTGNLGESIYPVASCDCNTDRHCLFQGAAGDERFSSYCETETFNASCPTDHVILMTHARYGRMQLSRCVKMDYGHIGCASDVIEAADWRCSGRRRCKVRVPDAEFARNKPCPDDLKPYLEAAYVCVRGIILLFLQA